VAIWISSEQSRSGIGQADWSIHGIIYSCLHATCSIVQTMLSREFATKCGMSSKRKLRGLLSRLTQGFHQGGWLGTWGPVLCWAILELEVKKKKIGIAILFKILIYIMSFCINFDFFNTFLWQYIFSLSSSLPPYFLVVVGLNSGPCACLPKTTPWAVSQPFCF
jgi:hypothetical protein